MKNPSRVLEEEDDDHGEGFVDELDVIHEVTVDEEDLPDADDGAISDVEMADELYTVVCTPTDHTLVASGGRDDKGFLWKIGQGDWAFEIQGHKYSVSSLAFSPDGRLLASGGLEGLIQIWDVSSGNLKLVRWQPGEHCVLASLEDSTAWMWNADSGAYLNMFPGHGGSVTCGDFTPDGKIICTGSDDATLRIYGEKKNHVIRGHPYHTEGITCLAISSDSRLALTGSKDSSVHIMQLTDARVVGSLLSYTDSIECIGFTLSKCWAATVAATISMDNKLIIWDVEHLLLCSTCDHELCRCFIL